MAHPLLSPGRTCIQRALVLAVVLLAAPPGGSAVEPPLQQGVLVIYSDARIQPGLMMIDDAIRSRLAELPSERLNYYNEYLDVSRFPMSDYQERLATYLAEKYQGQRVDALLCVRDAAFEFVLTHRENIFPGTPVLHLGVGERTLAGREFPSDVAGLPMAVDAQPVVDLARRLHPDARFAVVGGASCFDLQWIAAFRRALAGEAVTWLVDDSLEEIEQAVADLPLGTVLLMGYFGSDSQGRTYVPIEAGRRVFAASSAPTYVCYSNAVGTGAVGGSVFDLAVAGRAAGDALLRVLAGTRPADLGLQSLRPELAMLDWRQLQRWGIDEGRLPPGAQVLYREPGFWERYRVWIVAAGLVIVLQALLITALLGSKRRLVRTQASLVEGERRMGLATAAAKLGVWVLDIPSGAIWASEGCRRMIALGEAVDGGLSRLLAAVHPDDRSGTVAMAERAIATCDVFEHECRVLLPGGDLLWVAGRGRVECDVQGHPRRMLGVVMDIGERKRMERDAAMHRSELAHLARVASMGELSGSIAHELNQPLTAILSNAQAALRYLDRPDPDLAELRAILGDIAQQDQRAGEVIQRMRAMLRKDETRKEAVDLRRVVEDVLALIRSDLVARNVTCLVQTPPRPAMVLGDPVQLQQVLINLVVNGCDAMTGLPPERRRLVVTIAVADDLVSCEVVDHGPGIPSGDHERVFEPFVSTKPNGLGMGLSICRSILAAHDGELSAHDHPEGGACLRLRMPILGGPSDALRERDRDHPHRR